MDLQIPEPEILYEDNLILVLSKPAGWIVNEARTTSNQPVLQDWLLRNFDYSLAKSREQRAGIVHRLDKETSGVLLVAKTKEAFEKLQAQFKKREVKKKYLALVHGKLEPPSGEIKATVGRLPWNRERFGILPGGREAITRYSVISNFQFPNKITSHHSRMVKEKFSLVELHPQTGRTHQIRIHLKYIGHPIVGDPFYAGRKTSRSDRKWCPRLFLHATQITFIHPASGKMMTFISKMPQELGSVLASLEKLPKTS